MRKAADLLRDRADAIAPLMTREQGKPLPEAKGKALAAADVIGRFAEEGHRTYGRVIPARAEGIHQLVIKEPVGPVAAFTPRTFPINPAIVFDHADVDAASRLLAAATYCNAGQVRVSATRMPVQEIVYEQGFLRHTRAVKGGDGMAAGTTRGPMADPRRIAAIADRHPDGRRLSAWMCLRTAAAASTSMARYRSTTAFPAFVSTAPPPPLPPAAVSTTGVPRPLFSSSTSSQVRRYDIRNARPAAEIEPERAISSRTAIFPGPIRVPDARSTLMLNRSLAFAASGNLFFRGAMIPHPNTSGPEGSTRAEVTSCPLA